MDKAVLEPFLHCLFVACIDDVFAVQSKFENKKWSAGKSSLNSISTRIYLSILTSILLYLWVWLMFLFLSRQLRLVWINSFSYISSLSSPSIPLFLPLYFGGSSNSVFSSCCSCAPPPRLFISLAVSRERTQHVNFNKGRKTKHQSFFSHLLSYPISQDTQLYDGNKNVMSHTSNYARHKIPLDHHHPLC